MLYKFIKHRILVVENEGLSCCTLAKELKTGRCYRAPNIDRWSPGMRGSGSSDGGGLSDFIDGLGPGQLVGRQLLGAPTLGDVQLSMCYQKGFLEVSALINATLAKTAEE